jgi:hypothetical protein
MSLKRPCLGCGRLVRGASRCRLCTGTLERLKAGRRPERKTAAATRSNRELVADWRATHGDWCPGIPPGQPAAHPAHPCADLVADHLLAVALGGSEHGPRRVICRRSNSELGAAILTSAPTAPPRPPNSRLHSAAL